MAQEKQGEKRPKTLGEFWKDELAYAVADIRQKVVEEGAYGRPVTPETRIPDHSDRETRSTGDPLGRSRSEHFDKRCRDVHQRGKDQGRDERGPERGIDR